MRKEFMNGSLKKIALLSVFLVFIVGTVSALDCDAYVDDVYTVYYYDDIVFANETNIIHVSVSNNGPATVSSVKVTLSASDVGDVSWKTETMILKDQIREIDFTDPTIRSLEGKINYTVTLSDISPNDSNSTNNVRTISNIDVKFNGYKGKRYWNGSSDIVTRQTISLDNGKMVYYNQTPDTYKSTKWTTRTETWTPGNLPVPVWATNVQARLYISYNWDNTTGGVPDFTATFNTYSVNLGTPYTDMSNMGTYGERRYGLFSVDVTSYYNKTTDNDLVMTPNPLTGYTQALYPSTLVVTYSDLNETKKKIYFNEECDELLVDPEKYGTTEEEATAYVPFSVDTTNAINGTLYSFVASGGSPVAGMTNEGNLFFNTQQYDDQWDGNSKSAFPVIKELLPVQANNIAKVQGTTSGKGMLAIEQILVVEYSS